MTFIEQGESQGDCLKKIVKKYGLWFTVMREKPIRIGGFLGIGTREGVEMEIFVHQNRALMEKALMARSAPDSIPFPGVPASVSPPTLTATAASWQNTNGSTLDFEEAKKKVLAAAGRDPEQITSQQMILDELREIKEKIKTGAEQTEEHPSLIRIGQLLKINDFSERYTAAMLERARKELPLEMLENFDEAQDQLLEWIGESISIYEDAQSPKSGKVLVLVGPTGVGKTTTIAKLAAVYGLDFPGKSLPMPVRPVHIITIDAYRMGAREQIEKYGDIMGIPVSYVDNRRNLRREIALYQDEAGILLVDTIGKSPKNSAKLGEMKEVLDACGSKAEIHLVLSASTKASDIEHILRQFEPFNYCAVVLTKLDETSHAGNVISALAERKKSVSWITDGQDVPNDIKKASVVRFLINLDDFKVNREKIEKRFPLEEADQLKWS